MLIRRGYRYRLYPTAGQAATLERYASVCRFVYNLALEQRDNWWRQYKANGKSINYFQQTAELTQLRAEVDWIREVPADCEAAALKDLDRAAAHDWPPCVGATYGGGITTASR